MIHRLKVSEAQPVYNTGCSPKGKSGEKVTNKESRRDDML